MTKKLFSEALLKLSFGFILVALFIFLPAGTIGYRNGWLFMGVLFIPMLIAGVVMMVKNPSLLKKRLEAKEKEKEQSLVIKLSGLMFLLGFVSAGLDFRFSWLPVPQGVAYAASAVFLFGYLFFALVLKENAYLSRTIEIQENQRVVDTGLYAIVRHPMYSATLLMFLSMPLILGSFISFIVFLSYPFIISKRIKNEEELLEKELDGYIEYKKKVRYRMIPYIW